MTKTKKNTTRKLLSKVVAICLMIIAIYLFVGVAKQIFATMNLQRQKELAAKELQALQEENASLISQKNKLEDPNYIETYARGEYMFSKNDEQIFYLPTDNDSTQSVTTQPEVQVSETPVPEQSEEPVVTEEGASR